MYKATEEAKNAGGASADPQADNADDVTDVDFEEVDEEKK